jgi:hypothetical protein
VAADVDSDDAGTRPLAGTDAESWASEESVGPDAIAASSCGGAWGGDWDGDAPGAEGVSMTGKWRQDGRSAAHRERLRWISALRTLIFGRDGTPGPFFQFYADVRR